MSSDLFKTESSLGLFEIETSHTRVTLAENVVDLDSLLAEGGDGNTLFVTTQSQQSVLNFLLQCQTSRPGFGSDSLTFDGFLCLLDANRSRAGTGTDAWKEDTPGTWKGIENRILPRDLTIVITIEPMMSVTCVLSMLGAVQWAADVSKRDNARIRIISFSSRETQFKLAKFASLLGLMNEVIKVPMRDRDSTYHLVLSRPGYSEVMDRVQSAPREETHAILWFNADLASETALMQRLSDMCDGRDVNQEDLRYCASGSDLMAATQQAVWVTVYHMSHRFSPTATLRGFDHVHVLTAESGEIEIFSDFAGQVVKTESSLSTADRQAQLTWCDVADCDQDKKHVYITAGSLSSFLSPGAHLDRRIPAANAELGGFIYGVRARQDWGLPVRDILTTVASPSSLVLMMTRMRRQNIMPPGLNSGCMTKVLPLVGQDHRLAHLITQPTKSGLVMKTKVQLAALLTVGFENAIDMDDTHDFNALFDACRGSTRNMSRSGSMWLHLGLWKKAIIDHPSWEEAHDATDHPIINGTKVWVAKLHCVRAIKLVQSISALLPANTPFSSCAVENEPELSLEERIELQSHVLDAFVHQLTLADPERDRNQLLEHDVATDMGVSLDQRAHLYYLEMERWKQNDTCFLWGVYHSMRLAGAKKPPSTLLDWTHIPTRVVAQWRSSHSSDPDTTMHDLLIRC